MKETNKRVIEKINKELPFIPLQLDLYLKFLFDKLINLSEEYEERISEIKREHKGEDPEDYACEIEDEEAYHPISKVKIDWNLIKNKYKTKQELLTEEKQDLLLAVIDTELCTIEKIREYFMFAVKSYIDRNIVHEKEVFEGVIDFANKYIDTFLKDTAKEWI